MLIDDNVLLDVLQIRQPHFDYSYSVWNLCRKSQVEGYISALTFADIVYIMRKEIAYHEVEALLGVVTKVFRCTDLNIGDLRHAASMKWRDFEDAIQASTAERINADYIITRNTKDFEGSKVKALTPEEYFTDIFSVNE